MATHDPEAGAAAQPPADPIDAPEAGAVDAAEVAPASDAAAPTPSRDELLSALAEAEANAEEQRNAVLRAHADMDNLRKRLERDVENAHKFALERFVQELLPVKDSLELGLGAAREEGADPSGLLEGTELTLKMLASAIEKFGVREVDPAGEPFDPDLHQAMSTVEDSTVAPNTVVNVVQKGYLLNERLIRPAMVIVSKAPDAARANGQA